MNTNLTSLNDIRVSAIIVAGGNGSRMNSEIPKQFLEIGGKTILSRTINVFENNEDIDEIILVASHDTLNKIYSMISKEGFTKITAVVLGGETRQASVNNGLQNATGDVILIHDGVRPFVTSKQISDVAKTALIHKAAVLCKPITDTVKRTEDNFIKGTIDRQYLSAAQTPQGFSAEIIKNAHKIAKEKNIITTDDCALCEELGIDLYTVCGSNLNIKITTPEDLILAEGILNTAKEKSDSVLDFNCSQKNVYDFKNNSVLNCIPRVGFGYDVHKLVPNRDLILGGIKIPYDLGLLGHSDADVLIHAIMDAMLGACAMGDIGKHFPDTDQKWKGADSTKLLKEVKNLLENNNFKISNIDATIIAQAPKLAPYIQLMREKLSEVLELPLNSVSIKATTTEKLGFCGRGEGIAAEAVATVYTYD